MFLLFVSSFIDCGFQIFLWLVLKCLLV